MTKDEIDKLFYDNAFQYAPNMWVIDVLTFREVVGKLVGQDKQEVPNYWGDGLG